ncbi:hypothetical protein M2132_001315 [Dysgonomonas sp. PH5-45]|uniref:hypothetical protein n=1 Tax=unclassified Dysgonomonas TaxID=2630389 RepID=UPI002475D429|nr:MULTISPECIES: hypothetical protein [unclassified Dysgonomonas]MDH6354978.1 hypothetical protein [Dysgonomonas sp. PH5-45]MDH6387898.1 hypothetical protein [Dysgonomonas sp. PH5-37]
MKNVFISLLLLVCSSLGLRAAPAFVEEYVDFTLNATTFTVNGTYVYKNSSERPVNIGISYSFSAKIKNVIIDKVYSITDQKSLKYRVKGNKIYVDFTIPANESMAINLVYRQPKQKVNVYYSTAAQKWKVPLQKVKYSLRLEDDLKIEALSLAPDVESENLFLWNMYDFMPEEDFQIVLQGK